MNETHRLDAVCEISMGQAPDGETYNDEGNGWPLIAGAGDFGEHHPAPKKYTTEASKLSKPGDVILGIRATIGEKVLSDGEYCLGRGVSGLRPKSCLDARYLWHWLSDIKPTLAAKGKGATFKQVNKQDIGELKIVLPPLTEQRRIAAILDQADALRAKRREALTQFDSLTQSIFIDMFGDPVANPKNWDLRRLDKLCEVGSSKRVFVDELVEAGIPFYRGTEIGQLGDNQAIEPSLFISKEHFERLKAETGVPGNGDLLLPSICPDGRIYMVKDDKPFYFKDGRVLWIKANKVEVNSVFLKKYLKQLFITEYSKIASGTTFAELKIFALKELRIYLPPLEIQNRFASIIESIEKQKVNSRAQQVNLDRLFGSLQHRAFRGEL